MRERWGKKTLLTLLSLLLTSTLCLFGMSFIVLNNSTKIAIEDDIKSEVTTRMNMTDIKSLAYVHGMFNYTSVRNAEEDVQQEDQAETPVSETPYVLNADKQELVVNIQEHNLHINDSYSQLSKDLNMALYDYCAKYFTLDGVTCLMPMIIANNETAIRADENLTFCSLYPSLIIKPTSVEDLDNMSTLTVLQDEYTFSHLANDWWTRDRGPLQMNMTYGSHGDSYRELMGPSEEEILENYDFNISFTAYTSKEGTINSKHWVDNAAVTPGDRFSIKDCCLRLASEFNWAFSIMSDVYELDSTELKIAMLSMYHGAGSLWLSTYEDKKIGYWNSGKAAYEYARALTSDEALTYIYKYACSVIALARERGVNPQIGLTNIDALSIYTELNKQGILKSRSNYIGSGDYSEGYLLYPLKALYNYMQLSILYNGG